MSAPAVEYIRGVLEGRSSVPLGRSSVPLGRHLPHVAESNPSAPPPGPPSAQMTRSQWERLPLSPDVELHIRRPLSRHQNKQVDRLIDFATELFEEDTP